MELYRQFLTKNDCFRAGKSMKPVGVMIHSTGANNPNVSRYVPGDRILGRNTAGNHWDQSNGQWKEKFGVPLNKCVHAFVGKLADGSVGVVQTLPWTTRGWHAGGSANETYIGFEICEDGLEDAEYFSRVYQAAAGLTAHLCGCFGLDPEQKGVVICHAEGCRMGIASNHADVEHWFSRFGVTMEDFRKDVRAIMDGEVMDLEWGKFADAFADYRKTLQDNDHAQWSAQALEWAKEKELFSGAPGEDGQPNYMWEDFVTREQLAVILYKLTVS